MQNTALCASAGLRLDLYIDTYGLTDLRIRALIWMGVVAAGLALTAWQILQAHSSRWLVLRCAALGVGVLYLCCFVNFAALIASVNIASHKASPGYICGLGPTASRAIQKAANAPGAGWPLNRLQHCQPAPSTIDGWRDWGGTQVAHSRVN